MNIYYKITRALDHLQQWCIKWHFFIIVFRIRYYSSMSWFLATRWRAWSFPADLSRSCMRELCTMLVICFDVINCHVQQFLFRFSAFGRYLFFLCISVMSVSLGYLFIHHIQCLIIHPLFIFFNFLSRLGKMLFCCLWHVRLRALS